MNTSVLQAIAKQSCLAVRQLLSTSELVRNRALSNIADSLESVKQPLLDIRGCCRLTVCS